MTVLIITDESLSKEAFEVAKKLSSLNIRCLMDNSTFSNKTENVEFLDKTSCDNLCDIVVSVGGDGTMLCAAQRAIEIDKPIFGINAGRVGFLCAFDFIELEKIEMSDIESLNLSERMLLEVQIEKQDERFIAINDIVISRGAISTTVDLKVFSDKQIIGEYRGDGVIVSTPTGSTGYSLSAGGPIVDPLLDIILVTPVCAHTMFVRSIALDGKKTVRVETLTRRDVEVYMSIDSTHMIELIKGFGVEIFKSKKALKLLSSEKRDYFEVLNKRIGTG